MRTVGVARDGARRALAGAHVVLERLSADGGAGPPQREPPAAGAVAARRRTRSRRRRRPRRRRSAPRDRSRGRSARRPAATPSSARRALTAGSGQARPRASSVRVHTISGEHDRRHPRLRAPRPPLHRRCRCSSPPPPRGSRRSGSRRSSALDPLLDEQLHARALRPEETPALSEPGRETFARSLVALRDTAAELPDCRIWACAAAVETTGVERRTDAARRRALDAAVPARGGRRAAGGGVRRALARRRSRRAAARRLRHAPARPLPRRAQRRRSQREPRARRLRRRQRDVQRRGAPARRRAPADGAPAPARHRAAGRAGHRRCRPDRAPRSPTARRWRRAAIEFSDRSEGIPQTFLQLAALTKDMAERVCGIER